MTESPEAALHQAIQDHIYKVSAARERACEAAIQSGGYGVLEIQHSDGSVEFQLSTSVPYGHIHVKSNR